MGNERATEPERETSREVSPDPTPTGGAAAAAPAAAPDAAPAQANAGAANLATEIVRKVDARDGHGAIALAATSPRAAIEALEAASKQTAFYELARDTKPYTAADRTGLTAIYNGCGSLARKRWVFSARFSVTLTADAGQTLTEGQLDTLHAQAIALPPGHVERLSTFTELRRVAGGSSYPGPAVNMSADSRGATAYAKTFRHEIGHAVDAKLSAVADLRLNKAGWKKFDSTQAFIDEVGGLGVPATYATLVRGVFDSFTTVNRNRQEAPGKFEVLLKKKVDESYTGDALTTAWTAINGCFGTSVPMDVAKASYKDGYAHFNFANFKFHSGRAYFCGHYYGKVMSMKTETHEDVKAWNNTSAAFSDMEWFAEVYAEWYKTGASNSGRTFPNFVQEFMRTHVDALGGIAASAGSAGSGGNNPRAAGSH